MRNHLQFRYEAIDIKAVCFSATEEAQPLLFIPIQE